MRHYSLNEMLVENFDNLPEKLQVVARYIIDHPQDVALLSMRELARRAQVSHTTVVRLAHELGFDNYEEVRAAYVHAMRAFYGAAKGARSASPQLAQSNGRVRSGDIAAFASLLTRIDEPDFTEQVANAASLIIEARNVFCIGLRAQHAVAHQFSYALSFHHKQVTLLDAIGGTGIDALQNGSPRDALLAISIAPYTRATIEIVQQAARRGVPVVSITDSPVSPLARLSRHSIVVPVAKNYFFQSVTPIFAAAEILAAVIAQRLGMRPEDTIKLAEKRFGPNVYWN